jgi:hypothetical protein
VQEVRPPQWSLCSYAEEGRATSATRARGRAQPLTRYSVPARGTRYLVPARGTVEGVPLTLPRGLARFNRVVTNPIQGVYAWLLPPWAVICHRGRRSGRAYRTPVVAHKRRGKLRVAVLYGEESDWVRNLLSAGGGQVVRGGRTYELINPHLAGRLLVADLGDPAPGFGRGPAAG